MLVKRGAWVALRCLALFHTEFHCYKTPTWPLKQPTDPRRFKRFRPLFVINVPLTGVTDPPLGNFNNIYSSNSIKSVTSVAISTRGLKRVLSVVGRVEEITSVDSLSFMPMEFLSDHLLTDNNCFQHHQGPHEVD